MNFKSLLKSEHLLSILHNVLTNETTKNKVSNVSIKGEKIGRASCRERV